MTQNRVVSTLGDSSIAGKNYIYNGGFDYWTRGAGPFTSYPAYQWTTDRWYLGSNTATYTVTRTSAAGVSTAPAGCNYYATMACTTTGSYDGSLTYSFLGSEFDRLKGKTVTVSFWAKTNVGTPSVTVGLQYNTAEGQIYYYAGSSLGSVTPTLTSTWTKFSFTATMPAKSDTSQGLSIYFHTSMTNGNSFDFWGVQLEEGSVATAFSRSGGNLQADVLTNGSTGFDGVLVSTGGTNTTTGSGTNGWAGYVVAGKNAIINGGMDIWQRGTTFTYGGVAYCADRWGMFTSGPAFTFARDSTTVPTGFTYSLKATAPSSGIVAIGTAIETVNAIQYAGQNVTVSMYLATSNSSVVNYELDYSTSTDNALTGTWTTISVQSPTTTTTMTRYSATFAVPSTAKSLRLYIGSTTLPTSGTINITGVQLELGSTATPFSRAGGSIGGELALCQRYYWRENWDAQTLYAIFGSGSALSTTSTLLTIQFPVQMRVKPPVLDYPTPVGTYFNVVDANSGGGAATSIGQDTNQTTSYQGAINAAVASGLTQFRPYLLRGNNSTGAYLGWSAEL